MSKLLVVERVDERSDPVGIRLIDVGTGLDDGDSAAECSQSAPRTAAR